MLTYSYLIIGLLDCFMGSNLNLPFFLFFICILNNWLCNHLNHGKFWNMMTWWGMPCITCTGYVFIFCFQLLISNSFQKPVFPLNPAFKAVLPNTLPTCWTSPSCRWRDSRCSASLVYTLPRIATVGVTVSEAEKNGEYTVAEVPYGITVGFETKNGPDASVMLDKSL